MPVDLRSDSTELILWEQGLTDDAVQSLLSPLSPTTTLLNLGRNKLRPRAPAPTACVCASPATAT